MSEKKKTNKQHVQRGSTSQLISLSNKLLFPVNNIVLVPTNKQKRKVNKNNHSHQNIVNSIHQLTRHSNITQKVNKMCQQQQNQLKMLNLTLNRLRMSRIHELKKKRMQDSSFNSDSLYDKDVKKSKSQQLKKQFEFTVKQMITKKQISSKQKYLKDSQQLWKSMNVKIKQDHQNFSHQLALSVKAKTRYKSVQFLGTCSDPKQQKMLAVTSYSLYHRQNPYKLMQTPMFNGKHLLLKKVRKQLNLPSNFRMKDSDLSRCIELKCQGDIKPWNNNMRYHKTDLSDDKQGDIQQWYNPTNLTNE